MDEFAFLKKFLILESHLKSKFPEFEGKIFSELLSYLKEKNIFPSEILSGLSRIWQIRNIAFGKVIELPKPEVFNEATFIFRKLGNYFKIKYV